MKNEKGFTLIEMIVVMAIIGVLAAILIPSMSGFISNSKNSQALANGRTFYTAAAAALTELNAKGTTIDDGPLTGNLASGDTEFDNAVGQLVDKTKFGDYTIQIKDGAIDPSSTTDSTVEVISGSSTKVYSLKDNKIK